EGCRVERGARRAEGRLRRSDTSRAGAGGEPTARRQKLRVAANNCRASRGEAPGEATGPPGRGPGALPATLSGRLAAMPATDPGPARSEAHTSELQSRVE